MKTWPVVVTLLLLMILLPCGLMAQIDRGAIKGDVVDSQKAAVQGAHLILKEESTGVTENTVSGSVGQFNFLNISPGVYTLSTEATGFSKAVKQHIVVGVNSTVALDVMLQPGGVDQTVTVSEDAARVETETSDIGTVITPREIKDLPLSLNGDSRSPLSFVLLTPGVDGSTPGATPDYRLHISGSSSWSNEVYIDGIPVSNTDLPGNIGSNHPPVDSISQFKIINNNANAEYGFSSGIVSFAFNSGTNQFHGSLFEYLQNDALNAHGYIFNALRAQAIAAGTDCSAKPEPTVCRPPGLKQNEFGGTIGGPVWIPKLYDGRNKTFFFVDYTGFRWRPASSNGTLTTIPNNFRKGDFSQLLGPQLTDASGNPITDPAGRPVYQGAVYDPHSVHTVIGPDGKSYQVRDPFPGNIIPAGYTGYSQVSQKVLPYFPMADNSAVFNNLVRRQSSKTDEHRVVVKIDEHINDKNAVSGSVFLGGFFTTNNGGLNLLDSNSSNLPTTQIRLTYNYAHSPTLVNNLNVGFLRDTGTNGPLEKGPGFAALGITGLPELSSNSAFPLIGIPYQNSIGNPGAVAAVDAENRYLLNDNVTMIRGQHTFTFGGEVRRLQRNNAGVAGANFTFDRNQTALNGAGFAGGKQIALPGATGSPVASFLFGGPDYTHMDYPISQYYRWLQTGVFFQDDWKATPRLTLNLGLRYDIQVPRTEKNGNVSSMDPTLPNPSAGGVLGAYTFYGTGPGRLGRPRVGNIYYKGFQPRLGFAYTPDAAHRTALRGGFAVIRPLGNDNIQSGFTGGYNAGFAGYAQVVRPNDAVGSPAYYWDNAFPANGVAPPGGALGPGILTGNDNPVWLGADIGLPPTQLYWTMQVQQQLTSSMVATVGYVGSHTYHIGYWTKPNQSNPALIHQKVDAAAAANNMPYNLFLALPINDPAVVKAGFTEPWKDSGTPGSAGFKPGFAKTFGPGATLGQSLRPFPQYGSADRPENPIGSVTYNGLQASLQDRFSNGLTFLLSYTFAKTIGDVDSNQSFNAGGENAIFAGSFFQDYYNAKAERAVTSSDIPHSVSLSYTYELPIGPGKKFLNHGGLVGRVTGGWSVSGIQHYQSGRPIHIEYDAFGSSNPFFAQDGFSFRPNIVPGQPFKNPGYKKSCSGPLNGNDKPCAFYINPAAFVAPPSGEFGNAPNFLSSLRMPAFINEDLSISKRTKIAEGVDLQLQGNFFNALNRTVFGSGGAATFIYNLAPPNVNTPTGSPFGQMVTQQNGPRLIQIGARLEF